MSVILDFGCGHPGLDRFFGIDIFGRLCHYVLTVLLSKKERKETTMRVKSMVVTAQYQGDEERGTLLFDFGLLGIVSVIISKEAQVFLEMPPDEESGLARIPCDDFGEIYSAMVKPADIYVPLLELTGGDGEVRLGLGGEIIVKKDDGNQRVQRALEAPGQHAFCLEASQIIIFRQEVEEDIEFHDAVDIEVSIDS